MSTNLGELFLRGGWVMWPLLIFSVLTWAVILERTYFFIRFRSRIGHLADSILRSLKSGDVAAAKQLCHSEKPQIADLFLNNLEKPNSREAGERINERSRMKLMNLLRKNLWILGTIGSASPFIGLLGTVVGILEAFHSMAEKGAGGFTVVAGGISEALVATAAGLIVAIIALLTYNIFVTAANTTISTVKLSLDEVLDYTCEGGKIAKA